MSFNFEAAQLTDVGRQRKHNEDACFATVVAGPHGEPLALLIVADGMGGQSAGEVASQIAIQSITNAIYAAVTSDGLPPPSGVNFDPDSTASQLDLKANKYLTDAMRAAVEQAHATIIAHGYEHPETHSAGSTVTTGLFFRGMAFIANVGDSRTYLLREQQLLQVTHDHSLVARLVESGQISRHDVYTHPQRNLIYRSLGSGNQSMIEVDVFQKDLRRGDVYLLCSDGLWEMVRDEQIHAILTNSPTLDQMCQQLIAAANASGGVDNISSVILRVS